MADQSNEFPTILGPDAVFKGQLQFDKGVKLLGKFEGEVNSEGHLVVAEGATLTGDVKAASVRIDGQLKGNVTANAKVQLTASAKLEGDVQTARLEVAEGAVLIGRCTVGVNSRPHVPVETKSASAPTSSVMPGRAPKPGPVPAPVRG
jgi:cytoskeletal protein CcmA (bactofilin family)